MATKEQAVIPSPQTSRKPSGKGSAVPDSNTLLAYKLLQDSWQGSNVFRDMLKNEMKWLMAGISLLSNDPWIAMRMGRNNLSSAASLAEIIKARSEALNLEKRITPIAESVLYHDFGKPNMIEMMPNRRKPAILTGNANNNTLALDFKTGTFTGNELSVGAPVAVRALGGGVRDQRVGGGIFG